MSDSISSHEYREEVKQFASNILEEVERHGDYEPGSDGFEDELSEAISEAVDSHQWIIYNGYHLDVLNYARNDPDEWYEWLPEEERDSHYRVLAVMAFEVFRADVAEEVWEQYRDMTESEE